jgi:hypothetical protein
MILGFELRPSMVRSAYARRTVFGKDALGVEV